MNEWSLSAAQDRFPLQLGFITRRHAKVGSWTIYPASFVDNARQPKVERKILGSKRHPEISISLKIIIIVINICGGRMGCRIEGRVWMYTVIYPQRQCRTEMEKKPDTEPMVSDPGVCQGPPFSSATKFLSNNCNLHTIVNRQFR